MAVSEQRLDGANVGAALQQMRGKTVPECVGTDLFGQSSPARRCLDRLVDHTRVHMMTPHNTRQRISRHIAGGEQILPSPLLSSARVFAAERVREIHLASTFSHVSG